MRLCVPRAGDPATATAPVAVEVAAHLLGLVGDPATATVAWDIDWQGPLSVPLTDEHAVQAACGIMHVHGRAAGRPAPLAVDYASTVAGVLAAQGVCAALLARAGGADVTRVRTSVGQAALLALAQYLAAATADGDDPEGCPPSRADAGQELVPAACSFVSADGVCFELEALDAERWLDFWRLLGVDRADTGRGWRSFQQRFATATCALPPVLSATVRRASFTAVRSAADRAGATVLPVRQDPLPPTVTPPWTLTPFPEPGGTTIDRDGTAAAPLEGLRVVESARRVQGPLAGHVLRLLGADVVRIEPPGGDPMRGVPPMAGTTSARFSALNAGKAVTEIDFTTDAGRRAVRDLVSEADVFLHNWAPGKAVRLGLDADDLRAARPGLVYAWASGWGDALGPEPPVGTDYLVQAHSGLAAAVRPADEPPAPSLMTLTDVLGGLVCAQGVLAALLTRLHTGRGARVDSSLFSAAVLVPRGPGRPAATGRPLHTRDGYIALGPRARQRPERLAPALGLAASASADAIASRARTRPTAHWLPRLAAAGVAVTPVCTSLADLARDPRFAPALTVGEYAAPLAPWEFS
ncbi:crotonobetainyl-CoA:carnitine CoA-transferase CaiB-like acyl-CoA transferase [Streptomyces africanus]|uniref:Crotonobetainyl-CoA:carnitine CoA-transferase CaiB-like acyl-CoA transferase n=1 Tax=Streptomyces africanus TaxID=231024 RepID=A0ABU0QG74_9ACTN|nr:CoA transferase [Streptomyces africanus]MDQ0746394.1 crotonobetainyl-CoA:carnitine CoA-transferase CaiB-like acyl-CoA transferase [Streptomyces africanus]